MEDLKCLICFEDAKDARACPRCAKIYCSGCIKKWGTNRRAIPCPHCRAARPVQDYVKLNFVDRLRKEWSEKEEIAKATSSKLDQLRSKNEKLLKQRQGKDKSSAETKCPWKHKAIAKDREVTELRQLLKQHADYLAMMSKASMALEKGLEEANLPERLTKLDEANRSMKLEIAGKDLELTMLRRQLKQEEDKWSARAMMKDRELEEANQSSKRKTSEKDRQLTRIRQKLTAFKLSFLSLFR